MNELKVILWIGVVSGVFFLAGVFSRIGGGSADDGGWVFPRCLNADS